MAFTLTSPAFRDYGSVPRRHLPAGVEGLPPLDRIARRNRARAAVRRKFENGATYQVAGPRL